MEEKNVPVVEVNDLVVHYETYDGVVEAVNGVSFKIEKKDVLGLVGETGAGKTTIALSLMQLLPNPPARIVRGSIKLDGEEIILPENASRADKKHLEKRMQEYRGKKISMIFQDPMTALNPVQPIGDQICEVIALHENCSKAEAEKKAVEMLEMVGIRPERYKDYPHQMSGGMKQRVVIAIALACNPELLIADEPTTALDVTIQAQVLDMMRGLKQKMNTSMLLITHDLGVVAEICDKVAIMYAGEIVEYGNLRHIFKEVAHPYTKGLFNSLPSLDKDVDRLMPIRGLMPDPAALPEGCAFHPRCPYADEQCRQCHPELQELEPGHLVRCLHAGRGVPLYFPDVAENEDAYNQGEDVSNPGNDYLDRLKYYEDGGQEQ